MLNFRNQSQLRKNVFSGSFTASVDIVLSIIAYPLYLHFVGAELYGLWVTMGVVISFSAIGGLGIDQAITKYIAEEYGRKDRENILKYISTAINLLVLAGICIFFIFMAFKNVFLNFLNLRGDYITIFCRLFPFIIVLSVFIFIVTSINAILKGVGRFDQASYFLLGGRFSAIIVSFLLFLRGYKIWGLYWGQVISFIFVFGISSIFIFKKIKLFYNPFIFDRNSLAALVKFGGTLTGSRLISMLLGPFIKVIITRYIGLAEVTYFEIANKVVMQIRSLFDRGINAIMPEISRLTTLKKVAQERINQVMKRIYRPTFLIGVPTFIILFFLAPFLLNLWLSNEYVPAISGAFRIILVGFLFNLLAIPLYYLFMGIGKVSFCFVNHAVQSILNVLLVSIFIALGITNFYLFTVIYSLSIVLSAIVLIILFFAFRKVSFRSIV